MHSKVFALSVVVAIFATPGMRPVVASGSSQGVSSCCQAAVGPASNSGLVLLSRTVEESFVRSEFRMPSGQVLVAEQFSGRAAREYIETKATTDVRLHRARARAMARLASKGYKKTETAFVVRRYVKRDGMQPVTLQDSVSTAEGEFVTWSWDDGDDNTWEGEVYGEDYGSGEWASATAQIEIVDTLSHLWYQYEGGGIGGGGPIAVSQRGYVAPQGPKPVVVAATVNNGLPPVSTLPLRAGLAEDTTAWKDFLKCQAELIGSCTLSCLAAGPAFWVCFFGCHSAGSVIWCVLWEWLWAA